MFNGYRQDGGRDENIFLVARGQLVNKELDAFTCLKNHKMH